MLGGGLIRMECPILFSAPPPTPTFHFAPPPLTTDIKSDGRRARRKYSVGILCQLISKKVSHSTDYTLAGRCNLAKTGSVIDFLNFYLFSKSI